MNSIGVAGPEMKAAANKFEVNEAEVDACARELLALGFRASIDDRLNRKLVGGLARRLVSEGVYGKMRGFGYGTEARKDD